MISEAKSLQTINSNTNIISMKPTSPDFQQTINRRYKTMIKSLNDKMAYVGSPAWYLLRLCEAGNKKTSF